MNEMKQAVSNEATSRRIFLEKIGRAAGVLFLGGICGRVLGTKDPQANFIQPESRYGWWIDPEKCQFCQVCESACVRKPSAVKAVNDQKKCSNCVVCYGHIFDRKIESSKIETEGSRVCPHNAVSRIRFAGGEDGYYLYKIDHSRCTGCGICARECNRDGSRSIFMVIRPDICFGCNDCAIAKACPHDAVKRVPLASASEFRGIWIPEENS